MASAWDWQTHPFKLRLAFWNGTNEKAPYCLQQSAFLEGIELTKKELLNTFSNHEINELAPEEGEKFNPKFHQAMFEGPHPDIEKGNIIQVMANGFTIGERLLRAAQVGVSSGVIQNKKDENKEPW